MSFRVGDRVRLIQPYEDPEYGYSDCPLVIGDEGVVIGPFPGRVYWCVRWDREHPRLHSCDMQCDDGHGWNVPGNIIEIVTPPPELTVFDRLESSIREAEHVIQSG